MGRYNEPVMQGIDERPPPLASELLTRAQVAARFQVTTRTIDRARKEGLLRTVMVGPKSPRFTEQDVQAWIDASRR